MATDLQEPPAATEEEPTGTVLTLGAVAQHFQVSLSTVKKDWRPNGMPGRKGAYDLAAIAEWRKVAQRRSPDPLAQVGGETPSGMAEFKERLRADVRIKQAEAEKRERLNRIAAGQMIEKELIDRVWAEHVIAAREKIMRVPRLMLPRFPRKLAPDLAEELRKLLESVCNDLAEWTPSLESSDHDD